MALQRSSATQKSFLRAYRFSEKEQDPAVGAIMNLMDRTDQSAYDIAKHGGPAAGTISNWIEGKTHAPQHKTLAAAARVCGYEWALVPYKPRTSINGKGDWKAVAPRILGIKTKT